MHESRDRQLQAGAKAEGGLWSSQGLLLLFSCGFVPWEATSTSLPQFPPQCKRKAQVRRNYCCFRWDLSHFPPVNETATLHLGAIQVLGYLLGALAGLLLSFS